MKGTETIPDSQNMRIVNTPENETDMLQHLQGLAQQYEEIMQLADFADSVGSPQNCYPQYKWNNPIGLVITGSSDASLV